MPSHYIPPVQLRDMETELRYILMIHASQIAVMRDDQCASRFLGVDVDWEEWDGQMVPFDIQAFYVWHLLQYAYDFAYQVGTPTRYLDENGLKLHSILEGFAKCTPSGLLFSPLMKRDSIVRQVVETAAARYMLDIEAEVSFEQAALLLDCTWKSAADLLGVTGEPLESDDLISAVDLAPILASRGGFVPTQPDCLPREQGS